MRKIVANSLNEMGFTEAGATVEKEGIKTRTRGVDDAFGGGNCEIIIAADDKIIHSVFIVEAIRWFLGGVAGGFDGFDALNVLSSGDGRFSDFFGANFGFDLGFYLEIEGINGDLVIDEGVFDEIIVASAELFDIESVFDTDDDVSTLGGENGSVLEPSGKISR